MTPSEQVITRIEVVQALTGKESNLRDRVKLALRDRNPYVKEAAVQFIEEHCLVEFTPQVEVFLKSRTILLRSAAATCLGELLESSGKAHHGLRALLADPDWLVRTDAMESLAMIEDRGAYPLITSRLGDENEVARAYAATITAEKCGKKSEPQLRRALKFEKHDRAKVAMLAALIELGDHSLLFNLLALLNSEIYTVRCATVNHIADIPLSSEERKRVIAALTKLRRTEPTRAVTSTIAPVLKKLRRTKS